mmetsp:Transcript_7602/g.17240  ORF Transcript_7602/g.17240 Transcript_7602/m.17240 type:complete len:212 (-) Transcript_7602:42-677(-)
MDDLRGSQTVTRLALQGLDMHVVVETLLGVGCLSHVVSFGVHIHLVVHLQLWQVVEDIGLVVTQGADRIFPKVRVRETQRRQRTPRQVQHLLEGTKPISGQVQGLQLWQLIKGTHHRTQLVAGRIELRKTWQHQVFQGTQLVSGQPQHLQLLQPCEAGTDLLDAVEGQVQLLEVQTILKAFDLFDAVFIQQQTLELGAVLQALDLLDVLLD